MDSELCRSEAGPTCSLDVFAVYLLYAACWPLGLSFSALHGNPSPFRTLSLGLAFGDATDIESSGFLEATPHACFLYNPNKVTGSLAFGGLVSLVCRQCLLGVCLRLSRRNYITRCSNKLPRNELIKTNEANHFILEGRGLKPAYWLLLPPEAAKQNPPFPF